MVRKTAAKRQKRVAEKKAPRKYDEWERTFDAIADIVFIQDTDFTIVKANKAFLNLLNVRPKEVIGKKCYEVLHKTNKPWPSCPYEKTKLDRNVHTEEVHDPKIGRTLLVTSSPIFDEKEELTGSVHIARDIAERKRTEDDLKKAKEECDIQAWGLKKTNEGIKLLYKELEEKTRRLQELDRLKSDFISTVSHELRTPLAITKEGISLVLDGIPGTINEKQKKILDTARSNIDRLSRIINNLLDISKIEAGKVELKRELVDVAGIARQVIASFDLKAQAKKIGLRTNTSPNEIISFVDADKIIQVFTNIIGNAMKFTEQGYIEASVIDKGREIECTVSDTGKGIAKESLPKMFDKFQQFGRTEGPGEKGTGLGLAISKEIVNLHKGRMRVESELGKGTKFTFTLPKYTGQALLSECIRDGMKTAMKEGTKMSLMLVTILGMDKVRQTIPDEKLKAVLADIQKALGENIRQAEILVILEIGTIAVLLHKCDRDGAEKVQVRMQEIFKSYINYHGVADAIKLQYGYAAYPDDAKSDSELIEKAREV